MADKLVSEYRVELAEPGCAPGMGKWGGLARLESDISPVFPYLNSILRNCCYDHANRVLIWQGNGQTYALRPLEIRVASVGGMEHAEQVVGEVVELLNRTWASRDEIAPNFSEKVMPGVMDIFKLLPRTNCKACGYPTCLAFAADLRTGAASIERCSPLLDLSYAQNLKALRWLFNRH